MTKFPVIKPMGEKAVLVEFAPDIDGDILEKVLRIKSIVLKGSVKERVEVITTYNSLLIIYHDTIEDAYSKVLELKELVGKANIQKKGERQLYHIPLCYDEQFGLDMEHISETKNMKKSEVIELHCRPVYTVFFVGFLPGFLYLGGLDERLRIPRKSEPRLRVKKGAVGIGENQTGIYPMESPGGWQILGNSPVPLFDKNASPPCEISAGDKIRFYSIEKVEYYEILQEVEKGNFSFEKEIYGRD